MSILIPVQQEDSVHTVFIIVQQACHDPAASNVTLALPFFPLTISNMN